MLKLSLKQYNQMRLFLVMRDIPFNTWTLGNAIFATLELENKVVLREDTTIYAKDVIGYFVDGKDAPYKTCLVLREDNEKKFLQEKINFLEQKIISSLKDALVPQGDTPLMFAHGQADALRKLMDDFKNYPEMKRTNK